MIEWAKKPSHATTTLNIAFYGIVKQKQIFFDEYVAKRPHIAHEEE